MNREPAPHPPACLGAFPVLEFKEDSQVEVLSTADGVAPQLGLLLPWTGVCGG